jgi:protein O-GlcNAc transferase
VTIPQVFQIAVQRHQAGRLAEAEALYRQILAVQPNHADALMSLGIIALQAGRHELAVERIREAIVLDPRNPAAHSNLGVACRAMGRLGEAVAAFRQAIQLKPDYAEAHNNLGDALLQQCHPVEAVDVCRRSIELKPDYVEAHFNLGNALAAQGRLDEASAAYRRAVELRPGYLEAHNNLGAVLKDLGRFDEAIAVFGRAFRLQPDYPEGHNNLGNALKEQGKLNEAIAAFRRALELKPQYPEAHNNLGTALGEQGQVDEAAAAFQNALSLQPGFPEAHNNLGNALKDQGELDEAIASYRRALALKPHFAEAHSNLIYALQLLPGENRARIAEEHQCWNRQFSDPVKPFPRPHANDPATAGRLRIGYVSPDLRDHPVGRYVLPLFEHHDRERFEIVCYSGVARPDWITARLRALAGEWRHTAGVSDVRLAEMIREDRVDILVDLAMHTAGNRLPVFAREPAPVQVAWLAYPGSTGLPGIRYRFTDARMEPPGEDSAWSAEEPVYLPDCWCCYRPAGEFPQINGLPALSAEGVTFGSLNNFAKVNDAALALWARILVAVKRSRLVMLCPEGKARERVQAFFGARGVAANRLQWVAYMSRAEYLRLFQRIDIGLDPFPCNGMTTTCDALWMGVPVLTLPGEIPASRAGLSLLSNVGLEELAAPSEERYARTAVELAGNLTRLADLRATLRPRMLASPLMDASRFARNVEAACRFMWERWRAGG